MQQRIQKGYMYGENVFCLYEHIMRNVHWKCLENIQYFSWKIKKIFQNGLYHLHLLFFCKQKQAILGKKYFVWYRAFVWY